MMAVLSIWAIFGLIVITDDKDDRMDYQEIQQQETTDGYMAINSEN